MGLPAIRLESDQEPATQGDAAPDPRTSTKAPSGRCGAFRVRRKRRPRAAAGEIDPTSVFTPLFIVPEQGDEPAQLSGVQKLALKLLLDALDCIAGCTYPHGPRNAEAHRRLRDDALAWVRSDSEDALMPFLHVCHVLGGDPARVRRLVKRIRWRPFAAGEVQPKQNGAAAMARTYLGNVAPGRLRRKRSAAPATRTASLATANPLPGSS